MASLILSIGTTPAVSAAFTAAAEERVNLFMTADSPQPMPNQRVRLQFQASSGAWTSAYDLQGPNDIAVSFIGPVVWRVSRDTTTYAVGVDRG